jgi:hypothetical protein
MPADDLPPISAALLAQNLIVTHHKGNGAFRMTQVTAQSAKKTGQNSSTARKESIERTALDRCYGQIGIPAVAAAARYQGSAKNPAYAPVPTKWDRAEEAA